MHTETDCNIAIVTPTAHWRGGSGGCWLVGEMELCNYEDLLHLASHWRKIQKSKTLKYTILNIKMHACMNGID